MTLTSPYRTTAKPAETPPRAEWAGLTIEPRTNLFPAKCRFQYRIDGGAWKAAECAVNGATAIDVRAAMETFLREQLAEHDELAAVRSGELR